jgi:RNA polymerase sigma-70 factor (ECF subfamily)
MMPQTGCPDALERARMGSLEAFESLVAQHAARLIRFCYHLTGDWDGARELAQETFARAWSCLALYDPARPFAPWLLTIAARLAAEGRRRTYRRAQAETAAIAAAPRHEASLETSLQLREALARLTPRQRQAVVLCDLHGFSASEASQAIGCSASTVRVLRFLARQRLRQALLQAPDAVTSPAPERVP